MPNFLWTFTNNDTGTNSTSPQSIALPEIKAAGNTSSAPGAPTGTSLVNVVRDFYWTYSPVGDEARAETPRIILTERKLRTNALISQLKYSLGQAYSGGKQTLQNIQQFGASTGATGAIQDAGTSLSQFIASLKQGFDQSTVGGLINSGASKVSGFVSDEASQVGGAIANNDVAQRAASIGKNAYTQVKDAVTGAMADDNNATVNSSPWLAPYRNLYLTDPTGWVYVLPYFSNNHANQGNNFADSGSTGVATDKILGPLASLATEGAGLFASLNNPTQITYIEKAKFYNYPTDGESITVEFPLINTGNVTFDDVIRNWQFLFLLLYQNRPGKTSNNVVDQPVIYQVEVPGVKFFPFCFMSSLNIEFMGSRREMNINIPSSSDTISSFTNNGAAGKALNTSSGGTSIPVVIPDAYKVSITLNSMIANSKNFMQHMIGPNNIVETGTSSSNTGVVGPLINQAAQAAGINIQPLNGILNGLV